jgi:hypothetical protein
MYVFSGRWTNTAAIVSDVAGHKKFTDSGVAVYGSTIAVGTKDTNDVAIYSDSGTKQGSLSVTNIASVAMYGTLIAAQDKSSVFVFEKISAQWTQMSTHTPSNINNVAMYSNYIVVGTKGIMLYCVLHSTFSFILSLFDFLY